jgi:hypothetical protein
VLGYDIELNPCCHDFVKYKKAYTTQELDCAFNDPNAFWVHPINRNYDDTLRKYTRRHLNNYIQKPEETHKEDDKQSLFLPVQVLNEIKQIDGWLSEGEAELLIAFGLKACTQFPNGHLVEVGSYHGKATILLGKLAKSVSDGIKVYSIDPHNGILGSTDQGLQQFEPSLAHFKKNIERANLSETVMSIVDESKNVKWNHPISLLLLDGLHDYLNISNDFRQFASWIEIGGYLAFHDFADYFPDVIAFANELISKKNYQKIQLTDSLLVLKKLN